jgi:hypothetical protein
VVIPLRTADVSRETELDADQTPIGVAAATAARLIDGRP